MKYSILIFSILLFACSRSRSAACDAYGNPASDKRESSASPTEVSDTITQIYEVRISSVSLEKKKIQSKNRGEEILVNSEDKDYQELQIKHSVGHLNELNQTVSYQKTQRTPLAQAQTQIEQELVLLGQLSPNSFEFHLNQYVAGKHNLNLISSLEKAAKMDPQHPEVVKQWAAYGIIVENEHLASKYLGEWFSLQADSQFIMNYAMNMMNSVDENGVLIVHAIEDTYSAFYLQILKGIRRDVKILSLELLQSEAYRNKLSAQGWNMPTDRIIGPDFLERFCDLNSNRNISLSLTIPREYFNELTPSLFLVGLTFVHSKASSFQNFYRNELIWNEKWDKDFLWQLINNTSVQREKLANYLPVLLQLHSVYVQEGNVSEQIELDPWINRIAKSAGKSEAIEKIMLDKE